MEGVVTSVRLADLIPCDGLRFSERKGGHLWQPTEMVKPSTTFNNLQNRLYVCCMCGMRGWKFEPKPVKYPGQAVAS